MRPIEPHKARKRFGQNFLNDTQVIHQIIQTISPQRDQHLVEIGPGQGAITDPLLDSDCQLDVIEIDRDLIKQLNIKYDSRTNFTLHDADALNFDFSILASNEKIRVVGNLPYNISTPLISHLLDQADVITDMHFMLQKEIVQRLSAQPGSKQYGRLSIMAQRYCHVEALFDVLPESFDPQPKVISSIVRMTPFQQEKYHIQDDALFQQLVKQAFAQRRKTIRNTLKKLCSEDDLNAVSINPNARAETVSLQQYVDLANHLSR